MVGLQVLVLAIGVRVPVPEQARVSRHESACFLVF